MLVKANSMEGGHSVKVVIIDDEKVMHLIMKRMLAKVEDVEIAGSFQETTSAFNFLTNNEVDLVFVDINIPVENGLAFARRLRESGRNLKLVFVTSYTEYALAAYEVHAYDFMVKPVMQERLHYTIERALTEKLEN